ncbi:flagellar basal body-associated FliL family protein [Novosphingobium sp.]|uniref:flagellar basal body-associated FliL family protein n=1 Tax=Novosphingobium sp. TaxID=1874826 RepID=UPI00286D6649|nr:flagellar basal body-associated FliL family protein [Novosphingobium sp.]
MSDTAEPGDKPKKKKKGKGLMITAIGALVLVAAGGGGTFALVRAGMLGSSAHAEKKQEKDLPKLIKKGEEDPYAPKTEAKEGESEGGEEVEGEGGSLYKTSYYAFTEDFTSNLKNSSSLVQINIACSTRRDGRVLMWLKKHELAIRSEILVVLADTPEEDAFTPEGKDHLQKRLTAAINKVLSDTEGFGGVDQVYFKSFLVQ